MTLRDLLKENEQSHWEAMRQTGFWGRQAAGCLFVAKDTGRFCISHRSAAVNEPNTWGTWGGAIDEGEDPAQAVRREIEEETGYTGELKLLPMLVFESPSGSFRYYNFLAVVATEFEPELNWETQAYRWVDYGDWPTPMHPGLKSLLADSKSLALMKHFADNKSTDAEPVKEIMRTPDFESDDEFLSDKEEKKIWDELKLGRAELLNIEGHIAYLYNMGGPTKLVVLNNSDKVVVKMLFSFTKIRNKPAYIVYSLWVSKLLRGNNLAAKIYKKLSATKNAIIVSDDMQTSGGEAVWTKGLPKLGIYPVPFDLDQQSVSGGEPYIDPDLRLAFKTGVKNLNQYLKSADVDDDDDDLFEVTIDNKHGAGETPNHQQIDYLGMRVKMKPSMFLKLAAPMHSSANIDRMRSYIEQGGAISAPQLYIDIPDEWVYDKNYKKSARVGSHEGRHRMRAILDVEGDEPIEVHLLPRGWRRRHLTPEVIEQLQQRLIPETKQYPISGPFFEPMDVTEDFTQRAKPGSRPGSLKRKAGKGKGEKITASDIKRLKSRANRMKQSDNAETRKRGIQLARQVSWYENFH